MLSLTGAKRILRYEPAEPLAFAGINAGQLRRVGTENPDIDQWTNHNTCESRNRTLAYTAGHRL